MAWLCVARIFAQTFVSTKVNLDFFPKKSQQFRIAFALDRVLSSGLLAPPLLQKTKGNFLLEEYSLSVSPMEKIPAKFGFDYGKY